MDLLNKCKLAAKTQGLVFVNVNNANCKLINATSMTQMRNKINNAANEKEKAQWQFRLDTKILLNEKGKGNRKDDPLPEHFCGTSIPVTYRKRALLLTPGDLLKKDTAITLAFQTNNNGTKSHCVAIASYGTANKQRDGILVQYEHPFEDEDITEIIESGKMFELDMICSKQGRRSTGTLVMMYVIAKELARKSKNKPKYDAVMISLAKEPSGKAPLQNIATRMGFTHVEGSEEEHEVPYYILQDDDHDTKQEKILKALPNITEVLKFCPVKQKSGLRYCV